MSKEMKSEFKNLIVEKLNFDDRKERLSNDIDKGDVHFFFMSLFGREAALSQKLSTSIMTSWGMSIYEQACEKLSLKAGFECETQEKVLESIIETQKHILILSQDIIIQALKNETLDDFKKAVIAIRYINLIKGKNNVEEKYSKQLSDLSFENVFGFK